MNKVVIKVNSISKQYRLGQVGTGSLSHDINRLWHRARGKDDPYLKVGEENRRDRKGSSDYVWALRDINFDINQGDRVGIIGRNGAGKSTLLKILSRTASPTTGSVKIKGKVASLLEVGTGFHPDLSGRDNIFMNGAVLGMSKSHIKNYFDQIVDFAGVERYIDTPVKRYSSGMYVRLAFAVAAHLESDILIVDEVLAVGDLEFQKKCLGKMSEVSALEGKTVIFVSHNMTAVQKLCNRGILMENGRVTDFAETATIVDKYLQSSNLSESMFEVPLPENIETIVGYAVKIQMEDANSNPIVDIAVGMPWQVRVLFKLNKKASHFIIGLGFSSNLEVNIRSSWSSPNQLNEGYHEAVFKEENIVFAPGSYNLTLGLSEYERNIQYLENIASFNISDKIDPSLKKTIIRVRNVGLILNPMSVDVKPAFPAQTLIGE